ncbi:3-oxoacyl-(acyl-carrier-protein) reductase [Listeria floridensis FSL S10-1187]|uniref:3-oxoacyl-(Acyl-carrier-protein) reductase n=1 Tax=Listeria floridensis FSL S10-1187 TaxID=1265817 RepID=A0ABN0RIF9_9LIST|nr:3-oxoacyl-ACP reductase FabG [Listeria floridensis]EUJ33718.1 3-oxoacyl-(acyl-carrier-protein) reductase [Listeria floridensis FSL S10-1187]
MGRFDGKVAVITGGANGIGYEIAKLLLAQGAKQVYSLDITTGAELDGFKQLHVDITNRDEVRSAAEQMNAESGRIDILINNAGITKDRLMTKLEEADWEQVMKVNLSGAFHVTQAILPAMIEQNSGSIINISSVVGVYGNIGQSNYAATKAGLIGLTYTWAKEFTRKGAAIRTNAVAPGYVNTEMIQSVPEHILDDLKAKNPLKRLAEPIEIANAVAFLASDESSYVNGHVLSVDGGMRI